MRRAKLERKTGILARPTRLARNRLRHGFVAGTLWLLPGVAFATTELPTPYDARAMAMGGTGVAHVHNGASIYHNPAALHEVKVLAVTVSISPAITTQSAPVEGPDTTKSADAGLVPLFLVGGAYRVAERLAIGAAFYPTGGFGAIYNNIAALGGMKIKGQVAISEFSPVATYSLLSNLAISVGYRLTYVSQKMTMPTAAPGGGPPVAMDSDMSGTSFVGVQAGLYFRPIERLRLGAVYRSKVTTTLKGSTTVADAKADSSTEISCPHGFKVGAAFDVIPDKLLLALDFKYLLYSESSKEMTTKMTTPVGEVANVQRLDWKNAFSGYFGAEYLATPTVPVRLGYLFTTSATPTSRPSPLLLAPGIIHGPTAGAGIRLAHWMVDAGAGYSWGSKQVGVSDLAADAGVAPGKYGSATWILAASATYSMQ